MMNKSVLVGALCVFLCACGERAALTMALEEAGDNRLELLEVINYYKTEQQDSLKLEAARFLIENMPGHGTVWSEAIDSFRQKVTTSDSLVDMKVMNAWWDELEKNDKPVMQADVRHLKAEFLIKEIDKAFEIWQSVPWKGEVSSDLFCKYVLPYRFSTELLVDGWRDSLFNAYFPLVKEAKTTKEAFEIVHDTIWKRLLSSSSHFPHIIDVVAMQHQRKAMCMQRCVALGAVMRALCIPAAIDNIGRWANYSNNGHAWAALIAKEGTYSIFEDEWEAKINNRIDATIFEIDYPIAEDYPLATDFKKKYSKIWRSTYQRNEHIGADAVEWEAMQQFINPFWVDVSADYGLVGEISLSTEDVTSETVYLCTYSTGRGWMPVDYGKFEDRKLRFTSLGDSVLYAVVEYKEGKLIPLANPFLLTKHSQIEIIPDATNMRTVVLKRKYPLTGKWMNKWAPMVGGRFEGSNDADFRQMEVLCVIDSIPVFHNVEPVNSLSPYRYVRYVSPKDSEGVLAEVYFYGENGEIKVVPGKSTIDKVELSLDRDALTRPDYRTGFIQGYDLGSPQGIVYITYLPWNDDNFVIPGHDYELFYFDKDWVSLGKKTAESYMLTFDKVPANALLYLKDHSEGSEERPFTYSNGKQVWW